MFKLKITYGGREIEIECEIDTGSIGYSSDHIIQIVQETVKQIKILNEE